MKHPWQEVGMNLVANFAVLASRRTIFDLPVCDLGWDDALVFINQLASMPVGQTVVSFVNARSLVKTLRDDEYRNIISHNLILPDGIALNVASQVAHRSPFPANLKDTSFVPSLLTFMERPQRIGLIGGTHDVVERAAASFRHHTPWHEFIIISGSDFDKEDSSEGVSEIERQKLDILIAEMGTPLQEKWIHRNIHADHARLVMTVGSLFAFMSGMTRPAPDAVRMMRLEWAYRLLQEPTQLWRRRVIDVPVFLYHVFRYRFSRRERILNNAADRPNSAPPVQQKRAVG
jgi:exopolysaccharide biosynthesis WecB/TagA/CpsF family protein